MSQSSRMMTWKHLLCMLALCVTVAAIAGEPSSAPTPPRAEATKATDDPFVGDYVGTFHPLGEYGGKPRPEDGKDFKPRQCGTCHTDARVDRSDSGYSLTLLVDHGKDKEGKPVTEHIVLKGERRTKSLLFADDNYAITLADGEATGGRTGRVAAEVKLKRQPASHADETAAPLHCLDTQSPQGLQELFRRTAEPLPLVSAHRGGAGKGLPENSLPTFKTTLRHTYAIMEVDPRYTRDRAIVLHHDPRLERTTNGKGLVADFSLQELQRLRLKDSDGQETPFRIPTLDEALKWARGKTILVLDQKDVPVAERVRKIEEHKAEAFAIVIVYSFKDAKACYELNKQIMMEVMIPSRAKVADFEQTGVPWANVVAFVGHALPDDRGLYGLLHSKGVTCMVGTSRNLDKRLTSGEVTDIKDCEKDYRALFTGHADLVETDLPREVGQLLYSRVAPVDNKGRFFHKE